LWQPQTNGQPQKNINNAQEAAKNKKRTREAAKRKAK